MDINVIVELIGTIGFPIAMVLVLLWFIFKVYKKSEDREDALREEIKENRETNAKAIATLTLYAERLTVIETDVREIKDNLISHN